MSRLKTFNVVISVKQYGTVKAQNLIEAEKKVNQGEGEYTFETDRITDCEVSEARKEVTV